MEILGLICLLVGAGISLVYGIKLLILAFETSVLWGLGSIFVPFVSLIFVMMHWDRAKSPFLRGLAAIPFLFLGSAFAQQV